MFCRTHVGPAKAKWDRWTLDKMVPMWRFASLVPHKILHKIRCVCVLDLCFEMFSRYTWFCLQCDSWKSKIICNFKDTFMYCGDHLGSPGNSPYMVSYQHVNSYGTLKSMYDKYIMHDGQFIMIKNKFIALKYTKDKSQVYVWCINEPKEIQFSKISLYNVHHYGLHEEISIHSTFTINGISIEIG